MLVPALVACGADPSTGTDVDDVLELLEEAGLAGEAAPGGRPARRGRHRPACRPGVPAGSTVLVLIGDG